MRDNSPGSPASIYAYLVYCYKEIWREKAELLPLPEEEFQKESVGDLSVMPNFRVRILPVLGTMPA